MNRTELLQHVRQETGHCIAVAVVYYVIQNGFMDEPPRNAVGRAVYSEKHLNQLLAYLKSRRGITKQRRRRKAEVEVGGQRRKRLAESLRQRNN